MRFFANIALFQLGWFVCVWQGGILALVATALIIALHFYFLVDKKSIDQERKLLINVFLIGVVVETLAVSVGALVPAVEADILAFSSVLPPLWLLCLWLLFATTLRHSLLWLSQRLWLSAVFAAVSAPSSYYAGSLLSPYMSLGDPLLFSLVVIGLLWAIALPLMMRFFVKVS